ncbi:MAG: hypothetical protein COA36_03525 [Desulfotalea sp.]|nr:MAG: hypothetical protein COA36_03525 [Desulfotalea sp.]
MIQPTASDAPLHNTPIMDIFNSLPVAVLQLASNTQILLSNNQANKILGWKQVPLDQPLFTHFIHPNEMDKFLDFFSATGEIPSLFFATLQTSAHSTKLVTIKATLGKNDTRLFIINQQDFRACGCGQTCQYTAILEAQYQNNPGGILMVNDRMKMISFNNEFVKIWGVPKAVLAARDEEASLRSIQVKLLDADNFLAKVKALYNNRTKISTDEMRLKDGRILYRHTYPVQSNGKYLGRVWYFLDITPLKKAQLQVEQQQIFQKAILDNIQDAIVACNSEGKIDLMNCAARALYNFTETNPIGKDIHQLVQFASDQVTPLIGQNNPLQKALSGETIENDEIIVTSQNGRQHTLRVNGQSIFHSSSDNGGAVISLHDITDMNETERQLKFMAYHDDLTGLPNRRLFHDLLLQTLKQATRNKHKVGILFLDMDNFKLVNDQHGHDAGDALLIAVGKTLQSCLRKSDLLCRWGGDEFVMGLPESQGTDEIMTVAKKICTTVLDCIQTKNHIFNVSVTIGISISPGHGNDPDLLIRNADVAMYHAKKLGKNRCELFSNDPIPIPNFA